MTILNGVCGWMWGRRRCIGHGVSSTQARNEVSQASIEREVRLFRMVGCWYW